MKKAILLISILATSLLARPPDFREFLAVQDSLRYLPPNMRFYELERMGFSFPQQNAALPDSVGLRLVGKWGAGPSVKVTGCDSIVFLSRGSEVVVIDFSDTAHPKVLSYIQVMGIVSRAILVGNRLYIGSTGSIPRFIDVFDVSNPSQPEKLGSVCTHLYDLDVRDTLVYVLDKESLKVYNFADAANPRLIGACRDSGYCISVNNGYAYLGDRWGLYIVDVRDPTNPQRVGSWGTDIYSVKARGNICCVSVGNGQSSELRFTILDVQNPTTLLPLSSIDSCGGYDIYLEDSLVFLSGFYVAGHEFRILSIRDSTEPKTLGYCRTPDVGMGVWANSQGNIAFVADYFCGLATIDIADTRSPLLMCSSLKAGLSYDVDVQGELAFVANDAVGLKILDVTMPAQPTEIGSLDSTRDMVTRSIAIADSFAFMSWGPSKPWLRSISVADPTKPVKAGGVSTFDFPADMVLRDSFLYIAQAYRFQVVNVARPRQPVLVGSCVIQGTGEDLVLRDTLAYVSSLPTQVINVQNPSSPVVVGTIPTYGHGIAIRDTFAFVPAIYDSMLIYNVSNPVAPVRIGRHTFSGGHVWNSGIALVDTLLYVGGDLLHIVNISDPLTPQEVGIWNPPYKTRRLVYSEPYLYAACWDAGICVLEMTQPGVKETPQTVRYWQKVSVVPSVTTGAVWLNIEECPKRIEIVEVYNAAGIKIKEIPRGIESELVSNIRIDLSKTPAGVYIVRFKKGSKTHTTKVIKTGGGRK